MREYRRFARKNKFVAEVTQIAGCAAATYATGGLGGAAGCAAITSAVTYTVTDGDMTATVRAGATAFVTAQLSAKIGGAYDAGALGNAATVSKFNAVALHGLLGGAMSVANGGKFGHGFAAGAAGKALTFGLQGMQMPLYAQGASPGAFANTDWHHIAARTAIAAAMGGTVSEIGGGTFANGAVTAAMQHLFNGEDLLKMVDNGGHSQTMGGAMKEKIWGAHHNTEPATCGMAEMAACVGLGVVYGNQDSAEYMAELSDVGESMNKVDEIATKTGIDPDRHVLKPLKASSDSIQILDNLTKIPQIYGTCKSQCLERAQNSHTQF